MTILETANVESPIGTVRIAVLGGRLCALGFDDHWRAEVRWLERRFGAIDLVRSSDPAGVVSALRAYFDGQLTAIDRIDVDMGGTSFQASVWHALRRVPAGRTTSYGELARAVGSPQAARAVGAANGQNPSGGVRWRVGPEAMAASARGLERARRKVSSLKFEVSSRASDELEALGLSLQPSDLRLET